MKFKILNKKGTTLVSNEVVLFIIGAAIVAVLILLMIRLLSPSFNQQEESAKSLFESFEKQIEKAEKGGIGEFVNMQEEKIYLVYFGESEEFVYGDIKFFGSENKVNYICMCYEDDEKTDCVSCKSLKHDVDYIGKDSLGRFLIKKDEKIKIGFDSENEKYIFR